MCTCIFIKDIFSYFGRNLDLDYSFNEKVILTPRNYPLKFKKEKTIATHYAFIGMGTVIDNYPLYAEATNEKGVSIAGLNFPENAYYFKENKNKNNYAPYELPLIILSKCKNIKEVKKLCDNLNIIDINFSKEIKNSPLHFMVSDKKKSIVIESTKEGLKLFDNPFNVLTNNPPFPYHQENIKNYLSLSSETPINTLSKTIDIKSYSFGQGGFGLPGDFSSSSRFIKTFFVKENLILKKDETHNVINFFKCLESVSMPLGAVKIKDKYEYTKYSSCINLDKGIYYYKTYYNPNIFQINLFKEKYKTDSLLTYDLNYNYKLNQ